MEMVQFQYLPHTHTLYAEDNTIVYRHIFEVNLVTKHAETIAPLKHDNNGRGEYLALKDQFVGKSHCDQGIKDTMNFLVNQKWTGNIGFSLQVFLNQNHASYTTLK